MVTKELVESVGSKVRDEIVSLIGGEENWPDGGLAAGQAVASLIWEALGMGRRIVNDVDIFLPQYNEVDAVRCQPVEFGFANVTVRQESYSRYQAVFAANTYREYRVVKSEKKKASSGTVINIVTVSLADRTYKDPRVFAKSLLRAFDVNAACAAVTKDGRIFVDDALLQFLRNRQLEINSMHTPVHSYFRFLRKYKELGRVINGGVYVSPRELARMYGAIHAVEMFGVDYAYFFDTAFVSEQADNHLSNLRYFFHSVEHLEHASPNDPGFLHLLKWSVRQSSFITFGEKSKDNLRENWLEILDIENSPICRNFGVPKPDHKTLALNYVVNPIIIGALSASLVQSDPEKKTFGRGELIYKNPSAFWGSIKNHIYLTSSPADENRKRYVGEHILFYKWQKLGVRSDRLLSIVTDAYLSTAKKLRTIDEEWARKVRIFLAFFVKELIKKQWGRNIYDEHPTGRFSAFVDGEGRWATMALFHIDIVDIMNLIFAFSEASVYKIREFGKILSFLFAGEDFNLDTVRWAKFQAARSIFASSIRPAVFRDVRPDAIAKAAKFIRKCSSHSYLLSFISMDGGGLTVNEAAALYDGIENLFSALRKEKEFETINMDFVYGILEAKSSEEFASFYEIRTRLVNAEIETIVENIKEEHEKAVQEAGSCIVLKSPVETDRFRVAQLYTPFSLKKEGIDMANCVGGYYHLVIDGQSYIFSLLDKEKKVRVTLELSNRNLNGNVHISQVFKKANRAPLWGEVKDLLRFFVNLPQIKEYFEEVPLPEEEPANDERFSGYDPSTAHIPVLDIDDPDIPF